jgi:tetraacyldisaccharide 4'-kinase
VYVTKDRKKALSFMNQNFMGAVVILDDGFQDIRIQKKASVVVMNGHKDPEDMFCLPYGELREPITALKDAMAIVLTNPTPAWKELLKKQTLFEANKKITPSHPTTKKESCVAFCGIGEPSNFYQDLENFYTICQFVVFDDHHPYSSEDVENLLKMKEKTRATCLVTTEKDYAKVNTFLSSKMQTLQTLKLEYVIEKGFFELLKKTLND